MMNKPFKGISVPYVAPERNRYRNGQFPEVGDLVTKEIAKEISATYNQPVGYALINTTPQFRKVTGVVVSTTSGALHEFQIPMVQWSEYDTKPVSVNPIRMELVSRG
jgi:hypothetical protein